jgi:alpha-amylase
MKQRTASPTRFRLLLIVLLFAGPATSRADVMMQGFYWDVPSPAAGNNNAPWWWDRLASQAQELRKAGFTALWLPPVMKGASGGYSVGYDPFDDYDIGSKDQKGTVPTRYGAREQLERCVAVLRANSLNVYVDLVENHRNGDDGAFHFLYKDAFGNPQGGRFQKGPMDFHPNVPQDPDVPDEDSSFGRDLAPVNGGAHWVFNGLNAGGDWLTRALDIQGYRLDYVKGISTDWLRAFLDYGAMKGRFAVGEYFEYDRLDRVQAWISGPNGMNNRCSAFDFPLRKLLKEMCDGHGFFDMRRLDHAGLAGRDPFHAVTWVENHDTDKDPGGKIVRNKALAYAYILTSEGYPCVFYRDYSADPGCYGMKPLLDKLVWIHEKLAGGATQQRWKDDDVFVYERQGGKRLLVGLNDNAASGRTVTVDTGFGPNRALHDYTGHAADIRTDGAGKARITLPNNSAGQGYVCYAPPGQGGPLPLLHEAVSPARQRSFRVTQEYAGAPDLDIPPAGTTAPARVCRVWAAKGTLLRAKLTCDTTAWTDATRVVLRLSGPTGAGLGTVSFTRRSANGVLLRSPVRATGWHAFSVQAFDTPSANARPAYRLQVTYTAPRALKERGSR